MLPITAWIVPTWLAAVLGTAGSAASVVSAPATVREAAARSLGAAAAGEPDVMIVQQAAAERATPSSDETESWRRRARLAGLLPHLVAEYRHDERSQSASGISSGGEVDYIRLMPGDTVLVRLAWNLDELILGRSELSAAAAAQLARNRRQEAAERATKLYFERLRLRLALVVRPPGSAQARAEAELELATVTAQLHLLTGLYGEELR